MGTARSFQTMLNEYLPNSLLKEELIKRDYILTKVNKDNKWKGGKIPVPFKASGASSIKLGGLTASADIAQSTYVRGVLQDYREVWGSMIFNHRDILDHSGKVKEDSFIRILPDTIEDFLEYMKCVVSVQLGTGPFFASRLGVAVPADLLNGIVTVSKIDRFMLDQKALIKDADSPFLAVYVIAIDLNTNKVTFSLTRGGAAADLSVYSAVSGVNFYHDGGDVSANYFTSLRSAFLSVANGGSATLHGQSKIAYPFLQAINIDGSAITASNIVQQLFDAYTQVRVKARGMATTVLMSYKHLGSCMKVVEVQKGGFKVRPDSNAASIYGWDEIDIIAIGSMKTLKFVGIQEMDDDIIMFIDWSAITFRTNGFFRKRTAPDGEQYFPTRTTAGYAYIVDTFLFGEQEVKAPNKCAIIYNIPAY